MVKSHILVFLLAFFMIQVMSTAAIQLDWSDAHATIYFADKSGDETMMGGCGYGDPFKQGYGLTTASLSSALFNNGLTCGACFEIRCSGNPDECVKGAPWIQVTATNYCPPDYSRPQENWCNAPKKHFELSMKDFTTIAYRPGLLPIQYRRVPCIRDGGVKFELMGTPIQLSVLVYNVAYYGDVYRVSIKGAITGWIPMLRNWGQNWVTHTNLVGQALSFSVTDSAGNTLEFPFVIPANWKFGQTFQSKINFKE